MLFQPQPRLPYHHYEAIKNKFPNGRAIRLRLNDIRMTTHLAMTHISVNYICFMKWY